MPKDIRPPTRSSRDLPYPSTVPQRQNRYQHKTPSPLTDDRHSSGSWSAENDEVLLQARQKGLNWQPIASQHFPGKTANACRKRFERLIQQRNAADSWDVAKVGSLAKAYMEVREQMWEVLAERIGEKWTNVEAKCFEKGLKPLLAAARSESRQERRESLHALDAHPAHGFMNNPRSRSLSRDSEAFNDSAIFTNSPYATGSRNGHEDDYHTHYPSSAHTNSSSSRLPTPNRTFSNSTGTFPPFTPTLGSTSPSFFTSTSPTAIVNPPIAVSQGHQPSQTLPSLRELSFPSLIASSLPRHHSPNIPNSMQAPVTTH